MASAHEVAYARSGDVHIAYSVTGAGPMDMVLIEGYLTHLDVMWEEPAYRAWIDRLASFARVIRFDKRGMGLSDRVQVGTLEQRMDDVRAVLDAVGSARSAVMGTSEGGPLAMLFAATFPDRVQALLLVGAEVREEMTQDWPWGELGRDEFEESLASLATTWGRVGLDPERYAPSLVGDDARRMMVWSQRMLREAASPGEAIAFKRMAFNLDARRLCQTVHVPTLVLHHQGDRVCHVENGRFLAAHIDGADYRELPGPDHVPWMNPRTAGQVSGEIEDFLTGERQASAPDRVLVTVLFTDIVDSTGLVSRLGDARWHHLLAAHHATVRRQLDLFRGREIDTAGDGFFAAFDGPARAIQCAAAIRESLAALGLQTRLGIHTGEAEVMGEKLGGLAVHIGARVAAAAAAGEILVSQTVHDLVAGSHITFEDRGLTTLKGVPGEWRLLAVTTT